MRCNRMFVCSQCLLSIKQIWCAIDFYVLKPHFNAYDTACMYDEGPDSAKQLDKCSLWLFSACQSTEMPRASTQWFYVPE